MSFILSAPSRAYRMEKGVPERPGSFKNATSFKKPSKIALRSSLFILILWSHGSFTLSLALWDYLSTPLLWHCSTMRAGTALLWPSLTLASTPPLTPSCPPKTCLIPPYNAEAPLLPGPALSQQLQAQGCGKGPAPFSPQFISKG